MENLNELTIVELTALYNSSVSSDKQIKKFRTKEQGIARVTAVLELKPPEEVVVSTQPAVIDQQTEGYIRAIRGELSTPEAKQAVAVLATLGQRRKAVKGVVKMCRDLLTGSASDEFIVNALTSKYVEGGYDEKAAKSSAQTILADTKKRIVIENCPMLDEALQAAAS